MQKYENQLKCHPALLIGNVEESALTQCGRISILDDHQREQMIYIYKDEATSEFEVRVLKLKPSDNYMPINLGINFKRYVSNDKFASFFFRSFYSACNFLETAAKAHPESLIRPVLEGKVS